MLVGAATVGDGASGPLPTAMNTTSPASSTTTALSANAVTGREERRSARCRGADEGGGNGSRGGGDVIGRQHSQRVPRGRDHDSAAAACHPWPVPDRSARVGGEATRRKLEKTR
ncbi:hypothetical protein GCM10017786_67500 [Amycolatopsis deserti]|uniref:Uncharacterized protein n=1 Tax=Amycolatopsis deserti TaxID=185696 RepID=A0ABQ3JHF1_9PSEU|nr:hypothetical protein GCM10017786_67500 [Amycolatopsis deserti]